MGHIAILPQEAESKAEYLCCQILPQRYMEDFTLLGFTVDKYEEAIKALEDSQLTPVPQKGGAKLEIKSLQDVRHVAALLTSAGVKFDFGDVAESIYQA